MENLAPVKSFLQDIIRPIVEDAVKAAVPAAINVVQSPYLTIDEVWEQYHISSSTVYRRFDSKELTKIKNGERTLVSRKELEEQLTDGSLVSVGERAKTKKSAK